MGDKKQLDAEELLHLAIEASNKNDNEKTIMLLKQALELDTNNAKARYLLGAIHAQIGMYDRAISDMQKATEIDPGLMTAHFQLGLLYITSGNVPEAEQAWAALDVLGEDNALFLFKRGILKMARNEFKGCISDLQKGIKFNAANKALNKDMQMLITEAEEALKNENSENERGGDAEESHVFASAYDNEEQ